MTIRHDARNVRARAESERIRLALGLLTPQEQAAQQDAERRRLEAEARESAKGTPLFGGAV